MSEAVLRELREALIQRLLRLNPKIRRGQIAHPKEPIPALGWATEGEVITITFQVASEMWGRPAHLLVYVSSHPRRYRDLRDWFGRSHHLKLCSDEPGFLERLTMIVSD